MTLWKYYLTICSRCSFLFHAARCALLDLFCKTKASSSDFARHLSFLALPEAIRLKLKGLWKVAFIASELQAGSGACSYPVSASENRILRFRAPGEVNIFLRGKDCSFPVEISWHRWIESICGLSNLLGCGSHTRVTLHRP
jgi:hypothetical protein